MTAASYRGSSRVRRPFAEFPASVSAAFRFSVECSRRVSAEGRLVDKRFIRETFACASATTNVYKMLVIIIS
jgi:hypothetical protein